MKAGEAFVKKTSQIGNATIWHAWLGYLGYQMLKIISSKKLLDGLLTLKYIQEDVTCQGCQYGKAHRLHFKSSSNRKMNYFKSIHIDLIGSTRTSSYSGYHYNMLFVDDHLRYIWVYFFFEGEN